MGGELNGMGWSVDRGSWRGSDQFLGWLHFSLNIGLTITEGARISTVLTTQVALTALLCRMQAGWQSGDAADCKSAYVGSIPAPASTASE